LTLQQYITNETYGSIGHGHGQINIRKFPLLKIKINDLLLYCAFN
jgi:hypothetical protein